MKKLFDRFKFFLAEFSQDENCMNIKCHECPFNQKINDLTICELLGDINSIINKDFELSK